MRQFTSVLSAALVAAPAALAVAGEAPAPAAGVAETEVLPQGFTEITARQVLVETAGIGDPEFREAVEALGKAIMKQGAEWVIGDKIEVFVKERNHMRIINVKARSNKAISSSNTKSGSNR